MVETKLTENRVSCNERSLKALDRAIAFSQGEFSLVLVRCNYKVLSKQILQRLAELAQDRYQFRELVIPANATTLFTTLQSYGHGKGCTGQKNHPALMILGLESVAAIEDLLSSSNQVRDEFRKRMPFPLVLWLNDQLLQKLLQFAPDFASWAATPIKFEISTEELINFLQQKVDSLFSRVLSSGRSSPWRICQEKAVLSKQVAHPTPHTPHNWAMGCPSRLELDAALRDLRSRQQVIEPQLEASLKFVLGQYEYASDLLEGALELYQESLNFWQSSDNWQWRAVLLFHIGLCYCRKADLHCSAAEKRYNWERAIPYLKQCLKVFAQAGCKDLEAQFITQLALVKQRLGSWSSLQIISQQSLELHQTYGSRLQLAQDYGWLAEVELQYSSWTQAQEQAQQALSILKEELEQPSPYPGTYPFLLSQLYQLFIVKCQRQLGKLSAAFKGLEMASQELSKAIELSEHRYEPQYYLHLLEQLRLLYFEQGKYLEAFRIKQEKQAIEQFYGLRAFIGASRLQPQRLVTNQNFITWEQPEMVAREVAASGRQQDVNNLMTRISRADYKLTVIHGPSGVGKSSLVCAGLVPALRGKTFGDRIAVPVVVQVYRDWLRVIEQAMTPGQELNSFPNANLGQPEKPLNCPLDNQDSSVKIREILDRFQANANGNLLTVLIFDQFEEFFFVCTDPAQRLLFYQFLRDCINLPFVKVIIALREDYLHNLLELEKANLEIIDNNILDKKIRYPLGNFSVEEARSIIESLTESYHVGLEKPLINQLVKDLAGEQGEIRPIELQVVGAQLQMENVTTLAQYQQRGPKEKLVEQYLEAVVKDCGLENEQTAWRVLYLLTDKNHNRLLKTRSELVESIQEPEKIDLILEILEKSGLLFLIPEFPVNRYQLVHDYLVDFICQKEQINIKAELEQLRKKDKQSQDKIEQLQAQLREKELRARLAKATTSLRSNEEFNLPIKKERWEMHLVGVILAALNLNYF